jgi:predicted nucleotidyltransferase
MKTIAQIQKDIETRRRKLDDAKTHIVKQLKKLGALRIILFGSIVTGNITPTSDLDFIVIMPSTKTGWKWVNEIYDKVDRKVSADIIAYTPAEFERMKKESSFVKYALKTGKEL